MHVEWRGLIFGMIIYQTFLTMCSIEIYSKEPCNGTDIYGLCYWSILEKLTFLDANSKCGENNGTLAEIPNHNSNTFVSANLTYDSNYTWIGIKYQVSRGYVDMHDMLPKFTKWKRYAYFTFDYVTSDHCVVMKSRMNAVNCGSLYSFLCSLPKESNGTTEKPCPDSMFALDGRCFWRSNVSVSFWEAERECQIKGGHLASVPDNETLEFFKFEISKIPLKQYTWIGIRYIANNKTYVDMFNQIQNFTDWEVNEPSVIVRRSAKYVGLRKQDGGWYTFPNRYLFSAVCSRRTACRGSELPLNVSTQLLHPFSDTVTELMFEFGSEVRLRHDRLLITVVCLHTGFWKPGNTTGCLCPCDRIRPLLDNVTSVAQKIVKIKQELLLKKDELSTIKRRKTSVLDIRPSAFALGSMLGVGIITTLVVVIAISDLPLLSNQIKLWNHKIRPR